MASRKYFLISEFARLSGISRKNLIFYDRIGLLSPEKIDPNNGYRYYSFYQIDTASVISSLREIGMSLAEIAIYLEQRSPQKLIELFTEQQQQIEQRISRLRQIQSMIGRRIANAHHSLTTDTKQLYLRHQEAESLFLGPPLPPLRNYDESWYYLSDFYDVCSEQGIGIGLPVGALVTKDDLLQKNWKRMDRFFFRLPQPIEVTEYSTKPAGIYLVGYEHTDYGKTDGLYQRMFDYIAAEGMSIIGDSYEEFLIDEISSADPERYLLQICIEINSRL